MLKVNAADLFALWPLWKDQAHKKAASQMPTQLTSQNTFSALSISSLHDTSDANAGVPSNEAPCRSMLLRCMRAEESHRRTDDAGTTAGCCCVFRCPAPLLLLLLLLLSELLRGTLVPSPSHASVALLASWRCIASALRQSSREASAIRSNSCLLDCHAPP